MLIFSTVHIGNHGANEKDKIRTCLKSILQHFFNLTEEEATYLKREGNFLGDQAFEDTEVERFCSRDYFEMLSAKEDGSVFKFNHYEMP